MNRKYLFLSHNESEIEERVNDNACDGWRLLGPILPEPIEDGQTCVYFCATMTRLEEDDAE